MYSIAKADGNLKSAFSPKAYVVAKPPEDTPNASETTVEDAIEVGAEEVEPSEEFPGYFTVSFDVTLFYVPIELLLSIISFVVHR